MDYEKKYKEALERAKKFEEKYGGDYAGYIFPELAENEDERIIRFLRDHAIEMIAGIESDISQSIYNGIKGHSPEDEEELERWQNVRTWLEKQKEPQNKSMAHEDSSWSGILTSPLCKDKNLDDIAQEYVEGVKEYNPTPDWNLIHTAVCYGYHLAKQKEQKPAEVCYGPKGDPDPAGVWRPSEEQMRALERASTNEYLSAKQFDILVSLYEQLKKL